MSRFIISGGGTGGHVFPAIAIAQAIRIRQPGAEILFIGAKGRLEMEKVPAAGFDIQGLPIAGFIRRWTLKNLTFPFKLIRSLQKARSIINRFEPDVVIGVGGYASGPILRIATSLGIPALIQEQNSFPGVTNRLLGNKVQTICVAYEGMERYFPEEKLILTGNPVRNDLTSFPSHLPQAFSHFGLDPSRKTILVMGGSGGSRSINKGVLAYLSEKIPENVQLLWQTGKYYFDQVTFQVSGLKDSYMTGGRTAVIILPFIDRMDMAYSCADLVVSRAGAIAISELCLAGKPTILVPSPNVAEDHQTKNAMALVNQEAAVLIPDPEVTEKLPHILTELIADEQRLNLLHLNISRLGIPDAAERIASEVFMLLKNGKNNHGS